MGMRCASIRADPAAARPWRRLLAALALVPLLAGCGEPPAAGDALTLVAEGVAGDKPWALLADTGPRNGACVVLSYDADMVARACAGDPVNRRFSRPGSYGSSHELAAGRGWIVFEAVPERVAKVRLTVARYPRTTTTFDVYHPAGPRPVTRTLEARTTTRPGLPARYWVLVTPPGFEVPPRGAVVYLDANGRRL
jgi:hypothetical protein